MKPYRKDILTWMAISLFIFVGCSAVRPFKGNVGKMSKYEVPEEEAEWIRQGEPIDFEDELWYPQDHFDILLDSEVLYLGDYREVSLFVEKIDVRPYKQLYTKFGRNKFRIYKRQ